jgi:hypothetical protein
MKTSGISVAKKHSSQTSESEITVKTKNAEHFCSAFYLFTFSTTALRLSIGNCFLIYFFQLAFPPLAESTEIE